MSEARRFPQFEFSPRDDSDGIALAIEPADTTDHDAALSATFTVMAVFAVIVIVLVLVSIKGGRK